MLKDLSLLGRDLSKVVIIDNLKENFELQPDNGIHITTWTSDPKDQEFFYIAPFLLGLAEKDCEDVRMEIKQFK